jgi:hypothetical protein
MSAQTSLFTFPPAGTAPVGGGANEGALRTWLDGLDKLEFETPYAIIGSALRRAGIIRPELWGDKPDFLQQGQLREALVKTGVKISDIEVTPEYALSEPVWCTAAAMVPQTLYLMPSSCFEQFSNLPLKLPQRWSKDGRATWRSRPVSLAHMGDAHGPIPELRTIYDGARPAGYEVMKKEGGVVLGIGGDNSPYGAGVFYEGAITSGFSTNSADTAVMANVVAAMYGGT